MSRQLFDSVAAEYDAVRPDYPSQLYDTLESAMGQPLLGADVVDVGAGTGIASRGLAGRGARVVAVEPGPAMLHVLRSRSTSRVRAVLGDGTALPLRSGMFDLVVFAQSLHWIDVARADSEAFRVLKTGGVLAAWWNQHDLSAPWVAAHQERMFRTCTKPGFDEREVAHMLAGPPYSRRLATVEIPWSRPISIEHFGRLLRTKSSVLALGDRADALVEREMGLLTQEFPQGVIEEPFITYAVLARA
jgi:SAM-dependent methyltransferase